MFHCKDTHTIPAQDNTAKDNTLMNNTSCVLYSLAPENVHSPTRLCCTGQYPENKLFTAVFLYSQPWKMSTHPPDSTAQDNIRRKSSLLVFLYSEAPTKCPLNHQPQLHRTISGKQVVCSCFYIQSLHKMSTHSQESPAQDNTQRTSWL